MSTGKHKCSVDEIHWPSGGHGAAVSDCTEKEDGELWVDNGEYATRVNYCPFCGYKAREQVGQE